VGSHPPPKSLATKRHRIHKSLQLLADIFFHPAEYGFMPAFAVESCKNPMAFIRKDESFRWHSIAAERSEQLKALIDRHAKILLVRDDQRRRFDFICRQMRRASRKMFSRGGTPGRTAGFPVGKPKFFAFERHRFEVENAIVRDGGLEAIRVADEPIDGIPS